MPATETLPDFDQIADVFWRLGVIQSPAQLQGYLVGLLAVGDDIGPEQWLELAAAYIEAVQSPDAEDGRILQALYTVSRTQLCDGEMDLALLLPDDEAEPGLRVDALGQWCKGFLTGFATGGKLIKQERGQQQYSQDVSEALSDMAAISQVSLDDEDGEQQQWERSLFDLSEYLRMAAITIYLECHSPVDTAGSDRKTDPGAAVNPFDNTVH